MDNKQYKYIGDFRVEHYTVKLDNQEVGHISSGGWSSLQEVIDTAESNLCEKLMAGKKILNRYINTDDNYISFWTYKNDDEWWTL